MFHEIILVFDRVGRTMENTFLKALKGHVSAFLKSCLYFFFNTTLHFGVLCYRKQKVSIEMEYFARPLAMVSFGISIFLVIFRKHFRHFWVLFLALRGAGWEE